MIQKINQPTTTTTITKKKKKKIETTVVEGKLRVTQQENIKSAKIDQRTEKILAGGDVPFLSR